ncbi:hypothetical protein ABTF60_19515, partial [Acinetobacter baumannii]
KAYPTTSSTQSFERYDNLYHFAQKHEGGLTVDTMKTLLSLPISEGGVGQNIVGTLPTNHYYTYYSIIALPEALVWHIKMPD